MFHPEPYAVEMLPAGPVLIDELELLRTPVACFVRVRSADGAEGLAMCGKRIRDFYPVLLNRVFPVVRGRDARAIGQLSDEAERLHSNYKLGFAFTVALSWVEFAVWDLLGQLTGRSVGELFGGVRRQAIPVYLSSLRRDTSPAEEVEWLGRRLAETGARAVKLKIGGRMSHNADAAPGRSEGLLAAARAAWGDDLTIYVDANGSYTPDHAIAVAAVLRDHGVALFEEPCPFDDLVGTRQVREAEIVPVSGGEQDCRPRTFARLIDEHVVDVVQPDVSYNGGFVRTLRVARHAAAAGLPIMPHGPAADPTSAPLLHLVGAAELPGEFHEYLADPRPPADWHEPGLTVRDGQVTVPSGPGLGLRYDPALLRSAIRWEI